MRRDCQPCLVTADKYEELKRVDFTEKQMKEGWLQKALNLSPDILPVSKLDSSFAPLVSLGREILRIDNLFISPSGRLTIVEAKLWRNPEANRQVVSQIIDYAQKLRGLGYEELQEKARGAIDATLAPNQTIHELVSKQYPSETEDESDFIDAVEKTLSSARFMLLIVGDGIKQNLEGMVDILQTQPQMLFTFGLVELQVFEHKATKGKFIVPQIVAHSTEMVRAVVKVQTEGKAVVSITMPSDAGGKDRDKKRAKLNEVEFYDSIKDPIAKSAWQEIIAEAKDLNFSLESAGASVSLCIPNPLDHRDVLYLFRFTNRGEALPFTKIGRDKSGKHEAAGKIFDGMFEAVGKLFGVKIVEHKYGPRLARKLKAGEVIAEKEELLTILKTTADEIEELGEG